MLIDSGSVAAMVDASSKDLLDEIRRRHRRIQWHIWLGMVAAIGLIIAVFQGSSWGVGISFAVLLLGTPLLWWKVNQWKRVVRVYDLDHGYSEHYRRVLAAFDTMRTSERIWNVETHREVIDPKYHAGASSVLKRSSVAPSYALPPYFKSNIVPPHLPAGRQTLYFFPDCILVFDTWNVGAVAYSHLNVTAPETNFIEDERPPSDSAQVGQTWRYVNKNGTPDRRFANNRQLPVMRYGELSLRSQSGLNELFHVSRPQAAQAFQAALLALAKPISHPVKHQAPVSVQQAPSAYSQPWPEV